MAPLDQHPPHIRRKIALVCTIGLAVVLLIAMIYLYTRGTPTKDSGAGGQIKDFYTTIITRAQSYFVRE